MEKIIRAGIIGLGEQFLNNIYPAIMMNQNIEIAAACDSNIACIENFKKLKNAPFTEYDCFKKMLQKEKLDAVIAVTYPNIHYEIIKLCNLNKIPCFIEKPPCLNFRQFKYLIKNNTNHKNTIKIGMNFRTMRLVRIIKKILTTDKKYNLRHVEFKYYASKPKESLWGLSSVYDCFLLSQAIHPLDLLTYLLGEFCLIKKRINKIHNDIYINCGIEFKSGITSNLFITNAHNFFDFEIKLFMEKGTVFTIKNTEKLLIEGSHIQNYFDLKRATTNFSMSPLALGFDQNGYFEEIKQFISAVHKNGCEESSASLESLKSTYKMLDYLGLKGI